MNNKKKKSSSKIWLKRHFKDFYVREVHKNKIRSRAWFKLDQIHNKFNIFKNNNIIVDIGCSPGSWSEYALKKIGSQGKIIACDISFMKPIFGVIFIQGDIQDICTYSLILQKLKNKKADICMSDISPNISGHAVIDIHKSISLSTAALNLSIKILSKNGVFITKIFQGENFNMYYQLIKKKFSQVKIYKPHASRFKSREIFIIAKNIKE
ncbi:RlmE family RNA methyltransferase [Buchnera aphidicola]|uniref:RlmE family RNA methyltransferase n=1 Tax=Buchnera aphidicola TaxID=9 RepID=UPI002237ABD6|nr:SAM-dependent methyltransferase [Buchnera aphidicola]MCW5197578.1 rRNA methyltransferase [Buchnera aphidicola (Chaitophorus viminalis)]